MGDPDVKSNLGAYAQYGKLASGDELGAVDAFGSFLGALGDIGAAVEVVIAVINILGSLISANDKGIASLGRELDAIDKTLRALIGDERAQHLLDRLRGLDFIASPAETAFKRIVALLPPNPPPSTETIERLTDDCVTALTTLVKESQWRANVFETPYYDDGGAWAGQIAPDAPGGIAFSTKYILPTFLRTLAYFITFGSIFDPRFKDNNADLFNQCLVRLQSAYRTAVDGIVVLPQAAHGDVLERFTSGDQSIYGPGLWNRGRLALPTAIEPDSIFYRMYGAVSRFGEYFAIGNFPPRPPDPATGFLPTNLPEPPVDGNEDLPPDYFLRFDATYDLKRLAARKTTYRELGLGTMRSSIRSLQVILGNEPMDPFDPDMWWSLRDISELVAPPFDDPSTPPLVRSGRATISRLNTLSGTPQSALRTAFNAAVFPIELAPVLPSDDRPKALTDLPTQTHSSC